MQIGDFIEDTYKSFDGHIIAITRGVILEVSRLSNGDRIKYYCSQIHFTETPGSLDGMLGTVINRHSRCLSVLSQRGGKVVQNG